MRFFWYLLLTLSFLSHTNSRPLRKNELESEINELGSDDGTEVAAEEVNDDASNTLVNQELADREGSDMIEEEISEKLYQEANLDDESKHDIDERLFSDYKPVEKTSLNAENYFEVFDEKTGLRSLHNPSNKYIENNNLNQQVEPIEHYNNRNFKIYNANPKRYPHNKRTIDTSFDKGNKNNYQIPNYDSLKRNKKQFEQSNIIRYHNNENKCTNAENGRDILNRDRRNVQQKNEDSKKQAENKSEYSLNSDSANEELAIKQHIKRLSDTELVELMDSLTDDNRDLLQKIIDDDDNVSSSVRDSINKRDITKKAGAVEDNNFIEGVQLDGSQLESSNPTSDINTVSSEPHSTDATTSTAKQKENSEKVGELTTTRFETNSASETTSDLTSHFDGMNEELLDNKYDSSISQTDAKNNVIAVNSQATEVKAEAKRETRLNDIVDTGPLSSNMETQNDYYNDINEPDMSLGKYNNICPQYEGIAEINAGDSQSHNDKSHKREVPEKDNFDSIKALEESFPNSNSVTSSNSGPLVRVKRTDLSKLNMTKRLAEVVPEAQVGYYPHGTENIDADFEEGNELDNNILNDRASNFKSENVHGNVIVNKNLKPDRNGNSYSNLIPDRINKMSINVNNKKEKIELGSDNDGVLSGVEGVDENLMLKSNFRNSRA